MTEFCKICDPKCKYSDCICNENFRTFFDDYENINNLNY